MPPNPRKTGQCKICNYMKKHPKCDINRRIMQGDSITSIAKDTGFYYGTMSKHAGHGTGKDGLPRKPHFTRQFVAAHKAMEERAGLDLITCQQEVYEKSMKAAGMALGEIDTPATANLSAFGSCIGPATKMVEVLAKIDDKPEVNQTTTINNYDNLSRDELRDAIALATKIERPKEGIGEEKPA